MQHAVLHAMHAMHMLQIWTLAGQLARAVEGSWTLCVLDPLRQGLSSRVEVVCIGCRQKGLFVRKAFPRPLATIGFITPSFTPSFTPARPLYSSGGLGCWLHLSIAGQCWLSAFCLLVEQTNSRQASALLISRHSCLRSGHLAQLCRERSQAPRNAAPARPGVD